MSEFTANKVVQGSTQYSVVNDYAIGKISPQDEALDKFCQHVETQAQSADEDDLEELLTVSWKAIISAAAGTSFTDTGMQKLVEFVLELGSRPDLEKDGKSCVVHDMTLWKDLPTFGWQMRDAWNFGRLCSDSLMNLCCLLIALVAASDSDDEGKRQEWINLNAWTASLVAAVHKSDTETPDFTLYCIWSVRSALEADKASSPSDVAVAAAAVWFIFAAPTLHELSTQKKAFDGRIAAAGPAFADQDWKGFSIPRWQAWVERLRNLQDHVSDGVTKQLVQQALESADKASR
jgi:hypothetical protein